MRGRAHQFDSYSAKKIERASRGAERLARLVEALLDVSRITTGRFKIERTTFDLSTTLVDLVDELRFEGERSGCSISVRTPGPMTGAWDKLRIEQVIANLLANAFKFGAGKPVDVALERTSESVVISVRDHGPGVPQLDATLTFERYQRSASTAHYGGLGLGLYVSKQIVDAHGGTLAWSNEPDGGAQFVVQLPLELL